MPSRRSALLASTQWHNRQNTKQGHAAHTALEPSRIRLDGKRIHHGLCLMALDDIYINIG